MERQADYPPARDSTFQSPLRERVSLVFLQSDQRKKREIKDHVGGQNLEGYRMKVLEGRSQRGRSRTEYGIGN